MFQQIDLFITTPI